MPRPLPDPLVELSFANVPNHPDLDQLAAIWNVFTKCGEHLESGRRLENMTWRLWFREANTAFDATSTGCTPTPIATPRSSRAPSFALGAGSTNTILAAAAARATSRLMRPSACTQSGSLYDVNIPSDPENEDWSSGDEISPQTKATTTRPESRRQSSGSKRATNAAIAGSSRQRKTSAKAGPSRSARQRRSRPSSATSNQSAQDASGTAATSPSFQTSYTPSLPSPGRYQSLPESSPSNRIQSSATSTEQLSSSAATSPIEYRERERDRSRPLSSSSAFGSRARVRLRNQSLSTMGADGASQRRRPRPLSLQETIENLIGTGGKIRADKIGERAASGMDSSCELQGASRDLTMSGTIADAAAAAKKRDVGVGADSEESRGQATNVATEPQAKVVPQLASEEPAQQQFPSPTVAAPLSTTKGSSSQHHEATTSPPHMVRSISNASAGGSTAYSEAGSDHSATSRVSKASSGRGQGVTARLKPHAHAAHVHASALASRRNKSTNALHRPGHGHAHAAHPPLQGRRTASGIKSLAMTRAVDADSTRGHEKKAAPTATVAAPAPNAESAISPLSKAPNGAETTVRRLSVSPTARRPATGSSVFRSPRSRTVELPSTKEQAASKQPAAAAVAAAAAKKKTPVKFTMGCDDDDDDDDDNSDFEDESDREVAEPEPEPQPLPQVSRAGPPQRVPTQVAKSPASKVLESPVMVGEDDDEDGWSSDEPTAEELAAERAARAARQAAEEAAQQAAMFQKRPIRSASAADVRLPEPSSSRQPEFEVPIQPKGLLSSMFNRHELHPPPGQLAGRPHASAADLRHVPSGLSGLAMTSAAQAGQQHQHHDRHHHGRKAKHGAQKEQHHHPALSTSLASVGMPLRTSKSAVALPVLNTVASQTTLQLRDGPALDAADNALIEDGAGGSAASVRSGGEQRHRGSADDGDTTLHAAPLLKRQQSSTMLERLSALTKRGSAVFLPALATSSSNAHSTSSGRGGAVDDGEERRKARTRSDERLMEMQMNAQREVREAYATSNDGVSSQDGASMSEDGSQYLQQQQRRRSSGASSVASNPSVPLATPQRTASHEHDALAPPPGAAPQTPRTTRRNMLRDELSESLRQNLLWERQSRSRMLGIANIGPLPPPPQQQQHQQQEQRSASSSPPVQHGASEMQLRQHQQQVARQPSPRRAQHRTSVLSGGPLRALTPSIAPQPPSQQQHQGQGRDAGGNGAPPRRSSSSGNLAERGYGEGGFHHSGW